MLSLKEKGDLARLENKWWYDRSECRSGDTKVSFNFRKIIFTSLTYKNLKNKLKKMCITYHYICLRVHSVKQKKAHKIGLLGGY